MENTELHSEQQNVINMIKKNDHTKERITIRIDRDVLDWFRSLSPNGRGYQSRINQSLREYMMNGIKSMEDIMRKVMREELQKMSSEEH